MELLSNASIPDGLPASMTLLSEKPRLGVRGRESALHPGIDERNCTALLGLRFRCSEIVSGTVVAPNNAKQIAKQCVAEFNNSAFGGAVNFLSMASPLIGPDRLGSTIEDVGGSALKFGAYQFFKTASQTMVRTPFGSMSGFVSETIEAVAKDAVFPAAAAATSIQILVHAGCANSAVNATGQANIPANPGYF